MDKHVHHELTRKWAEEAGLNEEQSKKVAAASWEIDQKWWTKPWLHFAITGGYVFAYFFLWIALAVGNLRFLGYAVHSIQDFISHGWIMPWNHNLKYPEIDSWSKASPEMKKDLKEATVKFIKRFNKRRGKDG